MISESFPVRVRRVIAFNAMRLDSGSGVFAMRDDDTGYCLDAVECVEGGATFMASSDTGAYTPFPAKMPTTIR